jgi:hypothetical protein
LFARDLLALSFIYRRYTLTSRFLLAFLCGVALSGSFPYVGALDSSLVFCFFEGGIIVDEQFDAMVRNGNRGCDAQKAEKSTSLYDIRWPMHRKS